MNQSLASILPINIANKKYFMNRVIESVTLVIICLSIMLICSNSCCAQEEITTTSTTTTVTNEVPQSMQVIVNGQPVVVGVGTQVGVSGTTSTTTRTTTTVTNNNGIPVQSNCMVSNPQFDDFKRTLSSQTFEDVKVNEATQFMNTHCLASWQVRDIMKIFTFENSRLTFAQKAYPRTSDQANYYLVNEAFEYPTSVNQLSASIGQR